MVHRAAGMTEPMSAAVDLFAFVSPRGSVVDRAMVFDGKPWTLFLGEEKQNAQSQDRTPSFYLRRKDRR